MLTSRFTIGLVIAALCAGAGLVTAQSPDLGDGLVWLDALDLGRTAPVSEVGLVLVEAAVFDAEGRPVTGLGRDAFEVREDGRPRALESFRAVDLAPDEDDDAPTVAPRRVSENTPQARTEASRSFVIALDTAHLGSAGLPRARSLVAAFVDGHTLAGDRVVLLAPEANLVRSGVVPEDRATLLDLAGTLQSGRGPASRLTDIEAYLIAERGDGATEARARERLGATGTLRSEAASVLSRARERRVRLLGALTAVLDVLTTERTRKSVLLFSEGFLYEPGDALAYGVIAASQRAGAAIEFLDVRDAEALRAAEAATQGRLGPATGAELLSSVTGGAVVRGADPRDAFARISAAASHHYVLGYLPSLDSQGRRLRRLSLAVDGGDAEVSVQARRAYWYTPRGAGLDSRTGTDESLAWALRSAPLLEDIPVRLTALPLGPADDGGVEVALASEASLAALSLEETDDGTRVGELELVLDVRHVQPGASRTAPREALPVRVSTDTQVEQTWVPFRTRLTLPPGLSRVKVAVRDRRSGAIGTVAHEIEIPEPSRLAASAPILSDLPGRDAAERPRLVARRDFPRGSVLYCYFEIFPEASGRARGAEGGPSAFAVVDRRGEIRLRGALPLPERGDDGRRRHLLEIPLARMEPGEYELVLDLAGDLPPGSAEMRERFRVARPPRFDDDLYLGALAAFVEGDFERAVTSLLQWPPGEVQEAARRLPATDDELRRTALLLHTELAMLLRRHGLGERAARHLEIAHDLVRGEDHLELRQSWLLAAAFEYQQRELPAQALALYDECARDFPDRAEARLGAGTLQERYAFLPEGFGRSNLSLSPMRAARAAERSYRQALEIQPDLGEARLRLGRVLQNTGRLEEAVEELESVIGSGETGAVVGLAHLFRGEIAESLDQIGAAREHYRAALQAEPDLQVAALALAQILHRQHGRQAAAQVLVPALDPEAESPWLVYRRGPLRLSVPPLMALRDRAAAPIGTPE